VRLLTATDFALRVLMLLASEPAGRRTSVETLAQRLGDLSRNHLHKIVQGLTALGITQTARGAGGGVVLAVSPETVRLGTLVRHLESDQPIVECFRQEGCMCTMMPGCRLREMLRNARDEFYDSLERYTLADCLTGKAAISDRKQRRRAGRPKGVR
jgi:Rrf2 family transcriptional regulator, nitric oxide-sensitive transcriptional repressor